MSPSARPSSSTRSAGRHHHHPAEKTGRRARAIELDPKYVDVAVRRWERYTGRSAVLDGTGQTLEDVEAARTAANDSAAATEEHERRGASSTLSVPHSATAGPWMALKPRRLGPSPQGPGGLLGLAAP